MWRQNVCLFSISSLPAPTDEPLSLVSLHPEGGGEGDATRTVTSTRIDRAPNNIRVQTWFGRSPLAVAGVAS